VVDFLVNHVICERDETWFWRLGCRGLTANLANGREFWMRGFGLLFFRLLSVSGFRI